MILKAAGIDISKYQALSCRSASTSKAKVQGLSLSDILMRGQWSWESTWQKHNKKIENIENQTHFETVIFEVLSSEPRMSRVWFPVLSRLVSII